jgi:hypothetical protein
MRIHSWDISRVSVAQMDFTLTLGRDDLLVTSEEARLSSATLYGTMIRLWVLAHAEAPQTFS